MQTRLKLNTGDPGTKNLLRQFGDRLLCVRYRYDKQRHKRLKTLEIIIEEKEWHPEKKEETPNMMVEVKVEYGEIKPGETG